METTQLNYVASLGTNRAKGKGIISVFSQYVSEYVNNSLLIFFSLTSLFIFITFSMCLFCMLFLHLYIFNSYKWNRLLVYCYLTFILEYRLLAVLLYCFLYCCLYIWQKKQREYSSAVGFIQFYTVILKAWSWSWKNKFNAIAPRNTF